MRVTDFYEVLQRLPHRFPFRMIDRVLEIEPGKKAIALKNVSIDEPHFTGHFPNEPVMPGVLILEALAQTGGLAFHSLDETEGGGIPILARIEEFRLKRKAMPGDRLILEAEVLRVFSNLAKVKVLARVGDQPVAEGTLILAKGATASPSPLGGEGKGEG
jgi:3-hydroxyacyl-[acyl-carrier-protein] dehydratase